MKKILNRQGMALLSILLALVIIGLMCYMAFKYTKKNPDTANKSFVEGAGVDTSTYKGILESTKKILNNAVATRAQDPL